MTLSEKLIDLHGTIPFHVQRKEADDRNLNNRVVIIGGGTGTSTLVSALNNNYSVTSIVSTTDDGHKNGPTGRYIDAIGIFKSSYSTIGFPDLLKVFLRTLPSYSTEVATLFNECVYYHGLEIKKGYFILEKLRRQYNGEMTRVMIDLAGSLYTRGITLPMSDTPTDLSFKTEEMEIKGAFSIAKFKPTNIDANRLVKLSPPVQASKFVVESIRNCRAVIIAPGDILLSIGPSLSSKGIPDSIRYASLTGVPIILVLNFVTREFDTNNWLAQDFVRYIRDKTANDLPLLVIAQTSDMFPQNSSIGSRKVQGIERLSDLAGVTVIQADTMSRSLSHNNEPLSDPHKLDLILSKILGTLPK